MRPLYEAASREAERKHREAQLAERKRLAEVHAALDVERVERLAAEFRKQAKPSPRRGRNPNDETIAEAQAKLASCKPIAADDPAAASLRRMMGLLEPPKPEPPERQWLTEEPDDPV
jgi:hypothetical protein